MMSNAAVFEELERFRFRLLPSSERFACRNLSCANAAHGVHDHPDKFHRFGSTSANSQRWRCRACGATFSLSRSGSHRLRKPEMSEDVLKLLVNKVPMRRICEVANVGPKVLYGRISRLAAQCRAFAEYHETQFLRAARLERLHLNIDRQDHTLNWGSAQERRPIVLRAIATADVASGYVLGQHLNYDPDVNVRALELLAREVGDPDQKPAFRKYARLWLPHEAMQGNAEGALIAEAARQVGVGGIVHESYTTAAHIQWIKPWVACADYVQLTLDQEPGLDRFCLLTFDDRVKAGSLDAFFVRIDKDLTVAQRKRALADAEETLQNLRTHHPGITDSELVRKVIAQRWIQAKELAAARRPWIPHPYPTMTEPYRAVQMLTDDGKRSQRQIVAGLARATLRGVDRYFMQVRRKINILERPLHTASSSFRAWHGYNAYSPRVVLEALEIFRTIYNFHLRGVDRKTPAQRLGLSDHPVSLSELCAMSPEAYSLPLGRK